MAAWSSRSERMLRQILAALSLALLALSPLLVVVGQNIARVPLPSTVLWRSSLTVLALVGAAIWSGQWLTHRRLSDLPGWAVSILTLLALTWTGIALWPAVMMPRASASAYVAADGIVSRVLRMPRRTVPPPDRDIYLIILDGMGSPSVLASTYGLDVGDVVAGLQARGFAVSSRSRSAYPYTFLSLASTLNLGYLDDLAAAVDPATPDLYPLQYLIHRNALFQLAKAAGYRVVMIGSDYGTTDRAPFADVCRCRQPIPHRIEHAAMAIVPLLSLLPIDRWASDAHRAHLQRVLSDLTAHRESGPQFVMAHVLAPHPPFVFDADGPHTPAGRFSFRGPEDEPTRRREYRGQVQFLLGRVLGVVDRLLARDKPPVILIQADHGPASRRAVDSGDLDEEFGVFLASLFPDRTVTLPDDVSPLNVARALATEYLGVDLPAVPDRQWHADLTYPYALTRADPEGEQQ